MPCTTYISMQMELKNLIIPAALNEGVLYSRINSKHVTIADKRNIEEQEETTKVTTRPEANSSIMTIACH